MSAWEQWFHTAPLRVRSLFRGRELNRDLEEEFQYHIDRKADELIAGGVLPVEARRLAHVAISGLEQSKEECRDAWGVRCVQELVRDIHDGLRLLRGAGAIRARAQAATGGFSFG